LQLADDQQQLLRNASHSSKQYKPTHKICPHLSTHFDLPGTTSSKSSHCTKYWFYRAAGNIQIDQEKAGAQKQQKPILPEARNSICLLLLIDQEEQSLSLSLSRVSYYYN
jgi:hypothetical protein